LGRRQTAQPMDYNNMMMVTISASGFITIVLGGHIYPYLPYHEYIDFFMVFLPKTDLLPHTVFGIFAK
jgi:hypothetical protein